MPTYRMNCLLLSSCLVFLTGCTSAYKTLQPVTINNNCLQQFVPAFNGVWYKAEINVIGKYISGLLLIKELPDSSTRMVFTNEAGFTFFDFEFTAAGEFKVHKVIKQMNKKAVLKTLRKDFKLVLMRFFDFSKAATYTSEGSTYYRFNENKDYYYYVTDSSCTAITSMQRASKRKTVMEATMPVNEKPVPSKISIVHKNFNFTIQLTRLEK
jgi:hypothetical protein